MKLPSLNYVLVHARQALARYPLTLLSALLGVCVGIYLFEYEDVIKNFFPYLNLLLCLALGIPLFFCVRVFAYKKEYSRAKVALLDFLALLILITIYFTLPDADSTHNTSVPYIRYSIYNITIHLIVAFIPFIERGRINGFWQYNRILFVRFITSAFYSGVLYVGLALALGSLDFLFDIDLHDKLFFELFIFIGGFFNTWFFLAGIPEDFDSLDELTLYPKGIKVFSQYILLPLLVLYMLILYIYVSKIVLLWSWPKGIVSYLIACVAILGILTLLLLHPYGNLPGNNWIKKFSKTYYFILFPLVVLLFIAIGMRVADYGITINRYIIILLGVWLTIVCTYFAVGKVNIKFIPVSLAILLLLMSFGYWGMFSVSERSQVARLKLILEQGEILKNGQIQQEVKWIPDSIRGKYFDKFEATNEEQLNDSLHNEVKSILDYLDNHHGFQSVRQWYKQDIDSLVAHANQDTAQWNVNEAEAYMRAMGLKYFSRYENNYTYFNYNSAYAENPIVDIRNYEYLLDHNSDITYTKEYVKADLTFTVRYEEAPNDRVLLSDGKDTVVFKTDKLFQNLLKKYDRQYKYDIPLEEMTILTDSKTYAAKLEISSLNFYSTSSSVSLNSLTGRFFIRRKNEKD